MLVRLGAPLPDRARLRVHLGTAATDASIGRSGRDALELPDGAPAAIVRLVTPLAVAPGDRLVLRGTSGADRIVGAVVLDVAPPRGISRRRQTAERVGRLADGGRSPVTRRPSPTLASTSTVCSNPPAGPPTAFRIAPDIVESVEETVRIALADAADGVAPLTDVRATAARALRRQATIGRSASADAASDLVDRLVADGRLTRVGAGVATPGTAASPRYPIRS